MLLYLLPPVLLLSLMTFPATTGTGMIGPFLSPKTLAACNSSSFLVNVLDGYMCPSMKVFAHGISQEECVEECCTSTLDTYFGVCDTYIFNKTDGTCYVAGPSTLKSLDSCEKTRDVNIVGGQKYRRPSLEPLENKFYKPLHYARGHGTSTPISSIDLGESTNWTIVVDNDESSRRSIKVPGGGWNSDFQEEPWLNGCQDPSLGDVFDNVTYTTTISFPATGTERLVLLEFGSVNHGKFWDCHAPRSKLTSLTPPHPTPPHPTPPQGRTFSLMTTLLVSTMVLLCHSRSISQNIVRENQLS